MSGQKQKSIKSISDLKRNQSAPRKSMPNLENSRGRASTSASPQRIRVTQGTMGMARGSEHDKSRERASTSQQRIRVTQGMARGSERNKSRERASTSPQRKCVTQGKLGMASGSEHNKDRERASTSPQRIRVTQGMASGSEHDKSRGRASTSPQRKCVTQGKLGMASGSEHNKDRERASTSASSQRIRVTQGTMEMANGSEHDKSRGRASTSPQRKGATQGKMGMASGSEHDNANEFVNSTSSKKKRTLAMSTHTPQTPTAPEMPTTSFTEQNASTPTSDTEAGWTYFGNIRNANISPMLKSNTAATAGSDAASIADSDPTANADSDATVAAASEAAAVIDDNAEPPRAESSTIYSFPGSALGSESTANINGIKNDVKTENANNEEEKVDDSMYECNICLDTAKDAVVSLCGHLFCWPCLHQWLETRPNCKLCPVCKAAIGKDKVIPLYGRNSAKQEDPRNKVPPRPAGQRSEPEPQQGFQGFGFGDGFHMSFGIGAFPFGYFASSFNFGEPRAAAANRGTTQFEDEQQLSKLFLYLAFLCIAWLLFA